MGGALDPPPVEDVAENVSRALREDLGPGDLTASLISEDRQLEMQVVCREDAVQAGRDWFDETFRQLDRGISVSWRHRDGEPLRPEEEVCRLKGPARALLSGERTALNFLQTLSATATLARRYVEAVAGTGAIILDTRARPCPACASRRNMRSVAAARPIIGPACSTPS